MSVAKILLALLLIWILIGIIGLIIKGLFWLFVLGCVAFAVTGAAGWAERKGILGRR